MDVEELDWEPAEAGDQVVGYVTGIEYVDTKNGPVGVLVLTTKAGSRWKVFAARVRLRKQLVRQKVQPGDAVGIRYLGAKDGKNGGQSYNDYRVDVVRVGPRRPEDMLKDSESVDTNLVTGATQPDSSWDADDSWGTGASGDEEPGY